MEHALGRLDSISHQYVERTCQRGWRIGQSAAIPRERMALRALYVWHVASKWNVLPDTWAHQHACEPKDPMTLGAMSEDAWKEVRLPLGLKEKLGSLNMPKHSFPADSVNVTSLSVCTVSFHLSFASAGHGIFMIFHATCTENRTTLYSLLAQNAPEVFASPLPFQSGRSSGNRAASGLSRYAASQERRGHGGHGDCVEHTWTHHDACWKGSWHDIWSYENRCIQMT